MDIGALKGSGERPEREREREREIGIRPMLSLLDAFNPERHCIELPIV